MNGNELLTAVEPNSTQFFAFCDQIPEVDRRKPPYNCTGEYLKKLRPAIYEQALTMLVEPGISIRSICRTLHVSHNTLASIQEREAANLDTRKKNILKTVTRGLRLCAERVEELAPTMTARDALIGCGILGEKMQLLSDSPTQRTEMIQPVDVVARFREYCDKLTKRVQAREIVKATQSLSTHYTGFVRKSELPKGEAHSAALTAICDVDSTVGQHRVAEEHVEAASGHSGAL